jgi:hypothetical protein
MSILRIILVIVALEVLTVIGALAIGKSANRAPSQDSRMDVRAQTFVSSGHRRFASQFRYPPARPQSRTGVVNALGRPISTQGSACLNTS